MVKGACERLSYITPSGGSLSLAATWSKPIYLPALCVCATGSQTTTTAAATPEAVIPVGLSFTCSAYFIAMSLGIGPFKTFRDQILRVLTPLFPSQMLKLKAAACSSRNPKIRDASIEASENLGNK